MKIRIVSDDQSLYQLCKEAVHDSSALRRDAPQTVFEKPLPLDEICLWDITSAGALPAWIRDTDARNVFFLVEQNELSRFRDLMGSADLNIILKPVGRQTLEAFLSNAIEQQRGTDDNASVRSLRSDRDQILQCLIQTNLKLQQLEHGRINFLARTAHDFRAPLTAIEGYCGLLLSGMLGVLNDGQKEVLHRMQRSSQRLNRMAAALFELSIGRHLDARLSFEPGDIRDCLEQAVHEVTPDLRDKHIELEIDLDPTPAELYFDRAQIEQLVVNLLDNACKYTPSYGRIRVQGRHCRSSNPRDDSRAASGHFAGEISFDNCYRIDIEDTGPGIQPEIAAHLFEEFATYSDGADRSGGGLGLAIAKMIVQRHSGLIWGENYAAGARFGFMLPLGLGYTQLKPGGSKIDVAAGRM